MTPEELACAIDAYFLRIPADEPPADRPWDVPEARRILIAIADHGRAPAGREALALRLIFDHLAWIQQELPSFAPGLEDVLAQLTAGPAPAAAPGALSALTSARAALPSPSDSRLGWIFASLAVAVMAMASFNSTGSKVNALIQKVASSLDTVGATASPLAPDLLEIVDPAPRYAAGQPIRVRIRTPGPREAYVFQVEASGRIHCLLAELLPIAAYPREFTATAGSTVGEERILLWVSTRTLPEVGGLQGKYGLGLLRQNVDMAARRHGAELIHQSVAYRVTRAPSGR